MPLSAGSGTPAPAFPGSIVKLSNHSVFHGEFAVSDGELVFAALLKEVSDRCMLGGRLGGMRLRLSLAMVRSPSSFRAGLRSFQAVVMAGFRSLLIRS